MERRCYDCGRTPARAQESSASAWLCWRAVNRETKTIGPWRLLEKLGEGGNAKVYRATRDNDEDVALKVVKTTKARREPYRRFVQEIETLRRLGDFPGILPLLDSHLPERPSSDDRPWLAMPLAVLINEALAEETLETVVTAVRDIARTLTRLAAEHELGHRDLKPNNLYARDGHWLVGDFGLVAAPDLEELTRTGRPIGPTHFAAYELIRDPVRADPFPADVYSLGKTLWSLATQQAYPPEGHQPAGTRDHSIADLRPHPHAAALDRLIDSMTLLHPEGRPPMPQVGDDLEAWLQLAGEPAVIDVSGLAARLREKMQEELAREDLQGRWKEQYLAHIRRLQELTRPINAALGDTLSNAEIDVMGDRTMNNMIRTFDETSGEPDILERWQRTSQIAAGPDWNRFMLRVGRSLELTGDGNVIVRAMIDVGYPELSGHAFLWRSEDLSAPVGSVQAERHLEGIAAQASDQLHAALHAFLENVPTD
jgi:serine/threonine protein kinase